MRISWMLVSPNMVQVVYWMITSYALFHFFLRIITVGGGEIFDKVVVHLPTAVSPPRM